VPNKPEYHTLLQNPDREIFIFYDYKESGRGSKHFEPKNRKGEKQSYKGFHLRKKEL
jgi:hypothetical protein